MSEQPPILAVEGLSLSFPGLRDERVQVLDGVSFQVRKPETVALVGESGSGKSVSALAIMGVGAPTARIDAGEVRLDGRDLLAMDDAARRAYRGKRLAMIFQSPRASLNPLLKAGHQIARVVRLRDGVGKSQAKQEAIRLMEAVGINDPAQRYDAYPHQLSGGMAQRAMIAMALALRPELLIADEPTTALDVTIQRQIFDLLGGLQQQFGMSVLLITHDLAVVAETSDRVVVLYRGRVVETGPVDAILTEPAHPYTQRLVGSILRADRRIESPRLPPLELIPAERGPLEAAGSVPGHFAVRTDMAATAGERA
jgi:peptide/nickel transport system ATP-binding protein